MLRVGIEDDKCFLWFDVSSFEKLLQINFYGVFVEDEDFNIKKKFLDIVSQIEECLVVLV